MTDGLPTEERLRRIERGVQRRIDLRRAVAHRIAGTAAAVALLGGGSALLVPLGLGSSGGGSTAASGTGGSAAAARQVECHVGSARDSSSVQRTAPAGADDQRLVEACGPAAVDLQSGSGGLPSAASGSGSGSSGGSAPAASASGRTAQDAPPPSSSPSLSGPAVLCVASDGVLHVFPADTRPASLCTRNGMRPR